MCVREVQPEHHENTVTGILDISTGNDSTITKAQVAGGEKTSGVGQRGGKTTKRYEP